MPGRAPTNERTAHLYVQAEKPVAAAAAAASSASGTVAVDVAKVAEATVDSELPDMPDDASVCSEAFDASELDEVNVEPLAIGVREWRGWCTTYKQSYH